MIFRQLNAGTGLEYNLKTYIDDISYLGLEDSSFWKLPNGHRLQCCYHVLKAKSTICFKIVELMNSKQVNIIFIFKIFSPHILVFFQTLIHYWATFSQLSRRTSYHRFVQHLQFLHLRSFFSSLDYSISYIDQWPLTRKKFSIFPNSISH